MQGFQWAGLLGAGSSGTGWNIIIFRVSCSRDQRGSSPGIFGLRNTSDGSGRGGCVDICRYLWIPSHGDLLLFYPIIYHKSPPAKMSNLTTLMSRYLLISTISTLSPHLLMSSLTSLMSKYLQYLHNIYTIYTQGAAREREDSYFGYDTSRFWNSGET